MTDAALHRTEYGAHGTRVVFLHGLFGQGRNWTQFGKALADRHRVELIDLPDHGRSAWTAGFDQVEVADTIAAALAQGDDPVALIGHSLGGKVAMALALRHPALVERLCVVDVAPVGYERSREFAGYIEAMKRIDLDALTRREDAEAALLEAVPSATVRAFLLQNLRREGDGWRWQANLDGIDRSLTAISSWPADELASAPPYGGPVLWIGGARSDYITEAAVPVMDRLFPHNRRVTIKNAGHWVHSEQPEVFAEVLRRFLG